METSKTMVLQSTSHGVDSSQKDSKRHNIGFFFKNAQTSQKVQSGTKIFQKF